MQIIQVLPNGENSAVAVSGVSTIFKMAQSLGLSLQYSVVSAQPSKLVRVGEFSLETANLLPQIPLPDLVIIPSIVGDPAKTIQQNESLVNWLRIAHAEGVKIATLCTGAYLLAATGLLNGLPASSHCAAIRDLQQRFPKVKWMPEKIITDQNGLYTSGGTFSSFNLLIYLLAKYFDKQIALQTARFLQIDYPRFSQKPFYIFANQKNHADKIILQIQQHLEKHWQQQFNLNEIARQFGLSRRSLNRRFKLATGNTPQAYIQKIKIEQAKVLLEKDQLSINQIMHQLGYNDELFFRKLFVKITGELPSHYRKKMQAAYHQNL